MMFNGDNVGLPGVVSKPNGVFVENTLNPATIEASGEGSPSIAFRIESFWATRLFDPEIWPQPPLAASLICEKPWENEMQTQVKPITNPGIPIKFDNWQPTFCSMITFLIGYPNEEGGVALPAEFSMEDLSIVWYTPDGQLQHD